MEESSVCVCLAGAASWQLSGEVSWKFMRLSKNKLLGAEPTCWSLGESESGLSWHTRLCARDRASCTEGLLLGGASRAGVGDGIPTTQSLLRRVGNRLLQRTSFLYGREGRREPIATKLLLFFCISGFEQMFSLNLTKLSVK